MACCDLNSPLFIEPADTRHHSLLHGDRRNIEISSSMVAEPSNLFSLGKNVNLYWIGASGLAIWFLFIHSPPILRARHVLMDPAFVWHLLGAYSIYLACIHNTLVTPSVARSQHVWVGRIGMIMGVVGFGFGLYISWWPWRDLPPRGFSIGITIGGIAQIVLQLQGYTSIRRFKALRERLSEAPGNESDTLMVDREELERDKAKALSAHIESMISLFVVACGTPAAMRIAGKFGAGGAPVIVLLVVVFSLVAQRFSKVFLNRLQ